MNICYQVVISGTVSPVQVADSNSCSAQEASSVCPSVEANISQDKGWCKICLMPMVYYISLVQMKPDEQPKKLKELQYEKVF